MKLRIITNGAGKYKVQWRQAFWWRDCEYVFEPHGTTLPHMFASKEEAHTWIITNYGNNAEIVDEWRPA